MRSEGGLQGTRNVTLGPDKSAEIVNDQVVTGDISRPMATDGKRDGIPIYELREKAEESIQKLIIDINNRADKGSSFRSSKNSNKVNHKEMTFEEYVQRQKSKSSSREMANKEVPSSGANSASAFLDESVLLMKNMKKIRARN